MQDELDQKVVTLSVTASKFTAKLFYQALQYHQDKLSTHTGKQSLKHLKKQGQGLEKVDIEKEGLKEFKKAARNYNVDFSVTKEKGSDPPKFYLHFKARDETAINSAMKESLEAIVKKNSKKPLLENLAEKKAQQKDLVHDTAKTVEKVLKKESVR